MKDNKCLKELDVTRNFIRTVDMATFKEFNDANETLSKVDLR